VTCKSNIGEVYSIKNTDFIKKIKANSESWKVVLLMSLAKEKAIYDRVKKIKKLIKRNQKVSEKFGGFGVSLLKGNLLLNKNEIDVREKFKEMINDYPFVDTHKKIVEKTMHKSEDPSTSHYIKREDTRKTIDIDLKNL
jgi:hypothetical protein